MQIPVMELLAQICLNGEALSDPPRAPKAMVKRNLRRMFEPFFGDKVAYAVERLVVMAKMASLVMEEDDCLVALIRPKENGTCRMN